MKTVLFDFDGTIAETLPVIVELFNEVAPRYHLPHITPNDIQMLRNLSALELLKKYPMPPWRLLQLGREIQSKLTAQLPKIPIVPGLDQVFHQLAAHKVYSGIVTSNTEANVKLFLQHHHLEDVQFIHSERNIFGKGKILKNLIQKLKLDPKETWYVGDEVRDIDAAREAGIPVIAVTWGFNTVERLQKAKPEFLVTSPSELESTLTSLQV